MRHALLAIALAAPLLAQATPDAFLGQLPSPPSSPCAMRGQQRIEFFQKVDEALKGIEELGRKLGQENKEAMKGLEDQMKAQAMKAAGISEADAAKAKKMSKEEKQALAAQSLQAQTGMTMEDVQKLKGMSKEERQAWATGQASAGNLGPKAGAAKPPSPSAMPGAGLSMEDSKELQTIQKDMMARAAKIQQRYQQLEKEYAATPRPKPQRGYTPKEGTVDPICQQFAERYRDILGDHLAATRRAVQDASRLEALSAKQYGLKSWPGSGKDGLGPVKDYAHKLRDIFRFDR